MKTFNPKVNERVRVCYDGKRGRACRGVVTQVKENMIEAKFDQWAESQDRALVCCWFTRQNPMAFGGWLKTKDSVMRSAFGTPGDWYAVYEYKENANEDNT